ncbi:MAG: cation-translocating P-type ATPase [Deltaproteobacteria bacterium]|nr:cation-translocating P-type ATPase [Deltaproteobacteria bacterium]
MFQMILESSDQRDPATFRETELFKKCLEMGIIPGSETERDLISRTSSPQPAPIDPSPDQSCLSLNLKVAHMWCPACAWVIAESLKRDRGIVDARCSFSTDSVRCSYDPRVTSPAQIMGMIDDLGYKAAYPDGAAVQKESRKEFVRFVISAFLTLNVMMLSFALYSGFFTELSRETVSKLSWPIAVLASVVLFYGGHGIYRRAWGGLSHAAFSMETLITAGAFSAYLYSTYNLLFIGGIHLYYDTASLLVTLVLLGKALEGKAKRSVQQDLENLFSLRPTKVKICTKSHPNGRYVDARQLLEGDLFLLQEEEIVAADGIVLEGAGSMDESTITGESVPVEKKSGDRLRAGTRVIQGHFRAEAESVGDDSIFGQMIRVMEEALGRKDRFEEKTDVMLQWFVPIILFLALGTGLACLALGLSLEVALVRAVTVMVIACPCTFGVAVPLARVAGISLLGKRGILVRDFSSFERAGKMNYFVFDKTGTMTVGKWELLKVLTFQDFEEEQILAMAASLEEDSNHYIAMQIKERAGQQPLPPLALEDIQGFKNGVSGQLEGRVVKIGAREFLAQEWDFKDPLWSENNFQDELHHSLVYMAYGGKPCALFVFGDRIKQGALETVEQLKTMGLGVSLVSGDGHETTRIIAREIGVASAHGGQMPRDKAAFVAALQKDGNAVAMVGDGINDAPALAQADLALAVYSGNALSNETSDIILMRGEPGQVLDFLALAQRVSKKIHQNLFFAFLYNIISIPIAMSGLLTPLIAVSAMLLSSLSVTLNTLMLMRKTEKRP